MTVAVAVTAAMLSVPTAYAADPQSADPADPDSSTVGTPDLAALPDATDLTAASVSDERIRVELAPGVDADEVDVRRTPGTEPAASADDGRAVTTVGGDAAVDSAVAPGAVYTYTAFGADGDPVSDHASVTVGTPDADTLIPAYSLRPDVVVPTDVASLQLTPVADGTVTVRLDRAHLDVASPSASMQDRLTDPSAPICATGLPFLLREDVAGDQQFYGTITGCDGDVATVTRGALSEVFATFEVHQAITMEPIDLREVVRAERASGERAGSCLSDANASVLDLNPTLTPHGNFDVGIDGLVLKWNVDIGLELRADPRAFTGRAWSCETRLGQVSVPLAGGAAGLRVEVEPVIRASSDGKLKFENAHWTLDAGVRTSGKVGVEIDYCDAVLFDFPCGVSGVFEQSSGTYFDDDYGPDPDVDVVAELDNHGEMAAGALVRFEVGPESSVIGAVAGFQFDLLPLRAVLDRHAAAPEPQNCAELKFRPQLKASFYARVFVNLYVTEASASFNEPLGNWETGSGMQRVGDGCTPKADVAITKVAETPTTIAGESTRWRLDVTNAGPQASENVVVTDTLPVEHATAVGLDPSCSLTGRVITCALGTMAVGATRAVRFTAPVAPGQAHASTITNAASVVSTTRDKVPSNNVTSAYTTVDTLADLSITKVADREEYDGGDPITYTITATNAGPSWARDVVVTDPVPADVTITSVSPAASCAVVAQQVRCSYPQLTVGQTETIQVHGTIVGDPPPAHGTTHDHLLGIDRRDESWSLEAGQTGTFTPQACQDGGIVTDVSWLVSNVDQGTGTSADVVALAVGPAGTSTGAVTLRNDATGRAQGHVFTTCLRPTTVSGDDHRHAVSADPDLTRTSTLSAGRTTVTMPVGLERQAVAPGYQVLGGTARLVASQPVGRGWALTFEAGAAGASVLTTVRPLHTRSGPAGSPTHVHDLVLSRRSESVSAGPGRSTSDVACPSGLYQPKTIVGSFSAGAGTVLGHEGRENTRAFQLDNLGTTSSTSDLGVLCVETRTGPAEDYVPLVVNTATVTSTTRDDRPSDNTASVSISIHRAVPTTAGAVVPSVPSPPVTPAGTRAAGVALGRVRVGRKQLATNVTSHRAGRAVVVVTSRGRVVGRRAVVLRADRSTPVTVRLRGQRAKRLVVTVQVPGARDRVVVG